MAGRELILWGVILLLLVAMVTLATRPLRVELVTPVAATGTATAEKVYEPTMAALEQTARAGVRNAAAFATATERAHWRNVTATVAAVETRVAEATAVRR